MHTSATIANDLRKMGLVKDDVVLVRAALKALGKVDGKIAQVLIEALLCVVGENGTIIWLSHSKSSKHSQNQNVFRRDTPCITGGFAAAMLNWPGAYRSAHPTNSMVAIGSNAKSILRDHDEKATCFGPIRKLIDINGKMMLIGCIESSPGFSTVHLAYEELGLAEKSTMRGLLGAYYEKNGQVHWFAKNDVPGCSMGFGNFYPLYLKRGVLKSGRVGDAESMLIRAQDAYPIEIDVIRKNPRFSLCSRSNCFLCRGTKLFNFRDMIIFYLRNPLKLKHLVHVAVHRLSVRS
jgi:aminoglycoside 3-N-acetyltransferase